MSYRTVQFNINLLKYDHKALLVWSYSHFEVIESVVGLLSLELAEGLVSLRVNGNTAGLE